MAEGPGPAPAEGHGPPGQIFQLQAEGLPAAFPPLRSLGNPKLSSNLPAQVSSFIGREVELAEVRALVGGSRLVTLTGAGGAGKTRLGLQVAAGLADGAGDGVWFADLAPVGDPDLVAVTVADVLGVRLEPGRPVLGTVVEAVGGRSLLVVLDNCEHLIGACAKLADALLRGCPNLALLATSREPLGIDGERVYRVPSLGIPADGDDPGAIQASEAVGQRSSSRRIRVAPRSSPAMASAAGKVTIRSARSRFSSRRSSRQARSSSRAIDRSSPASCPCGISRRARRAGPGRAGLARLGGSCAPGRGGGTPAAG